MIFYFVNELLIHGAWDIFSANSHIRIQLEVWVFHEVVDYSIVLMLLLIATISGKQQLMMGEGMIDTSNLNFREELDRAKA